MEPHEQLLQNIHDELIAIRVTHVDFSSKLATIVSNQATFSHEILGNGQPGRLSKVEELSKSNTRYIDQVRGALVVVGTLLAASIGAVAAFIKHAGH